MKKYEILEEEKEINFSKKIENILEWENVYDVSNLYRAVNTSTITINKNVINLPVKFASLFNFRASLFYCKSINKFKLVNCKDGNINLIPIRNQNGKKICNSELVRLFNTKFGNAKRIPCEIVKDFLIIG